MTVDVPFDEVPGTEHLKHGAGDHLRHEFGDSQEEFKFGDLIDPEEWVATQNRIARGCKMAAHTFDRNGVNIVTASNYTNYVTLFQSTEEGARMCRQSLLEATTRADEVRGAFIYDCRCGLIKVSVPCYIGRYRLCSVGGGQVVEKEISAASVKQVAAKIGADQKALVEYATEVQIRERADVQAIGDLLFDVANRLVTQAVANRKQKQQVDEMARIQQQMRALSTPISEVWPGILALPIVGQIDADRARQVMSGVLDGISTFKAQLVIFDITGVPIVDSKVADHLVKTVQAVSLKGAKCIFTGISSTIAQTMVTLGIDLAMLQTAADLRAGIELAFRILGLEVVAKKAI
jgi:anti-anti-sigma regulatory factor/ligand-binding sensor protein